MSKGSYDESQQAATAPLRVLLDKSGTAIGLLGPDGTKESGDAVLDALGFVRAKKALTGVIEFSPINNTELDPTIRAMNGKITSVLGVKILDFGATDFLPTGAAFSGSGTYGNLGRLAVQSTGEVRHNPAGWTDGSACLEFTPNSDSGELRLYFDGTTGFSPLDFYDENGIALHYIIPDGDPAKANFSLGMEYANDAVSTGPANKAFFSFFRNDSVRSPQDKEFGGEKYTRFRFDSLATDTKAGPWPGYALTPASAGTGADWTKPVNFIRVMVSKFSGKTIKLKSLRRGGWSTPCIVLGTDNAVPDPLSALVAPLCAKNKVAAYANQYWQELDFDPRAKDRYHRLYAAGWELAGNDVVDRPLGIDVLDPVTMRAAITTTRDRNLAAGWLRGLRVWIANNNSTSQLMISELRAAGYVANRNGGAEGRYCFPEGGVPDRYRIPGASIDGGTLTTIQPLIDRCIEYGATMWMYYHNVWAKSLVDHDRTNNATGTAGAPIAVSAGETTAQYRARALALGTAVGNATVAYMDARIGAAAGLAIWFEDLADIINYIGTKQQAGALVTLRPSDWCADVGLL
ncbi:hypothetical protein [Rhodocyclus tenuis]|uniref:Uncharacterized protein n=1 Tax=Rhodocyclus tenuis TaxID=1066 RepID=A0A840G764_RHOTE|nr:hypothetical protein [Rhodocyclus tenuis]MBB4247251.1 hypothetical protein [Rhodocyclus tenuis]